MTSAEESREAGRRADLRRMSLEHIYMRLNHMQAGEPLEERKLLEAAATAVKAAMSAYKQHSIDAFAAARQLDQQALTSDQLVNQLTAP